MEDLSIEDDIKAYFRAGTVELTSNFSWLVMQRIGAERIALARQQALLGSTLITIGLVIGAVMLGLGANVYLDLAKIQIPFADTIALPACAVFAVFILIDTALKPWLRSRRANSVQKSIR